MSFSVFQQGLLPQRHFKTSNLQQVTNLILLEFLLSNSYEKKKSHGPWVEDKNAIVYNLL